MKMKYLFQKCEKEMAEDKSLPRDSYLITFEEDGKIFYDIVRASSRVEIFDFYYDLNINIKRIDWTKGNTNPKCYTSNVSTKK